jgi:type 1 glutamine amidotransferase
MKSVGRQTLPEASTFPNSHKAQASFSLSGKSKALSLPGMTDERKVLIVQGGWEGHAPKETAELFAGWLRQDGFEVRIEDSLKALEDLDTLRKLSLFIPIWTMGEIAKEQSENIRTAIAEGVGLAGCHGGMCDAFRMDVGWEFMTGGSWVSHPGNDGVRYTVNIRSSSNPITEGLADFEVSSEQYYLHVDPAVEVLATTRFPVADGPHRSNGVVDMPQVWTKRWGKGRVFYNALGHQPDIFAIPEAAALMRRGMNWAAR